MCLAMCLIFQKSEPSVLINRVLTEKKMCIHTEHVLSELILVKLTKTKVTVRLRTTIWERFVQNVLSSWPI